MKASIVKLPFIVVAGEHETDATDHFVIRRKSRRMFGLCPIMQIYHVVKIFIRAFNVPLRSISL